MVTWDLVRYYQIGTEIDRRNTFQLVIIPRGDVAPGDFDVELRYARCEWTTGSANGGTDGLGGSPAGAGFVAGDGVNFLALPGSQTAAVLNLCTTSNVGTPGLYRYQFRFGFPL